MFRNSLFTVAVIFAMTPDAYAQENARMRYSEALALAKTLTSAVDRSTHDLDYVQLAVESKQAEVAPGDIRIWIATEAGNVPLPVGVDGRLVLPVNDELLRLDPWIYANQPRGSLIMWAIARIGASATLTPKQTESGDVINYSDVFPMHSFERSLDRILSGADNKHFLRRIKLNVGGALLQSSDPNATVVLVHHGNRVPVSKDRDGRFFVPHVPEWIDEHTALEVSSSSKWTFVPVDSATAKRLNSQNGNMQNNAVNGSRR